MDKNNSKNHSAFGVIRRLALAGAALGVLTAAPASAEPRAERSLAGVAIFAPGSEVPRKFGTPHQILVGGVPPAPFTPATSAGSGAAGSAPGAQGGFPGAAGGASGSPGSLPGFPGLSGGFPGASSGGGFPGAPGGLPGQASGFPGSGAAADPVQPPVTLVYNRANGGSLEFTVSPDKRVIQIRETGYSGAYGTTRGIKLGTSYSAVVARYGYPEHTQLAGSIINIDYKDTFHCGFQFLDQRLVGIIVASPD